MKRFVKLKRLDNLALILFLCVEIESRLQMIGIERFLIFD